MARPGLEPGHHDFQSCALPTELSRRGGWIRVARIGATVAAVPGRRASLIAAAFAVVAAVVVAVAAAARAGTTEALRRRRGPSRWPTCRGLGDVVFDLDTRAPLVALAVEQLAPRVTDGALTADQVHALVGGARRRGDRRRQGAGWPSPPTRRRRVPAAARPPRRVTAWSSSRRAPPTSSEPSTTRGARGALRAGDLRQALRGPAGRCRRARRLRSAGPARPALATAGRHALGALAARRRRRADHARDRAARPVSRHRRPGGPDARRPADRQRPAAAQARGSAPLVVGLRDPAHTLAFARSAGLLSELGLLDQLPGFLKPDLSDLGPNGTVTSPSLDLARLTARTEPPDPGDWETKLGRIDTLAGLAGKARARRPEHRQERRRLHADPGRRAGRPRRRLRPRARALQRPRREPPRGGGRAGRAPTPGAAGALTARLRSSLLATQIPELIRARIGDVTAWARAELTGVTGELRLALR